MQNFLLILAGFFSGVFAGMGMGGGTFLIPILSLLFLIPQKAAQMINLMVFIPLSIICIIIYAKKKLIKFSYFFTICLPAMIVAIIGVIFSIRLTEKHLKIAFGVFLIVIAVVQIVLLIIKIVQEHKLQKNKNKY